MQPDRRVRDAAALLDIRLAAERTGRFTAGLNLDALLRDEKSQSAVLHQLLILGEAAKRVSETGRRELAGLPWSQMAGMRDRLIHAYDAVDLGEVWSTATRDVPSPLRHLPGGESSR